MVNIGCTSTRIMMLTSLTRCMDGLVWLSWHNSTELSQLMLFSLFPAPLCFSPPSSSTSIYSSLSLFPRASSTSDPVTKRSIGLFIFPSSVSECPAIFVHAFLIYVHLGLLHPHVHRIQHEGTHLLWIHPTMNSCHPPRKNPSPAWLLHCKPF